MAIESGHGGFRQRAGDRIFFAACRGILKSKRKLEQERDLLRIVTEGAPGGIFAKDLDGRYVWANRRFVEYMEVEGADDIVGKSPFDFMPPDLATAAAAEDMALKSGKMAITEREQSKVDDEGNVRWHVTTKVPLLGDDGKIVGIAGVQHDTTQS